MAPPAERPPSQQGPEYETLDALLELTRKVDELALRPSVVLPTHANWWDTLPPLQEGWTGVGLKWADLLSTGQYQVFNLPCRRSDVVLQLRVGLFADRIELTLQLSFSWIV